MATALISKMTGMMKRKSYLSTRDKAGLPRAGFRALACFKALF